MLLRLPRLMGAVVALAFVAALPAQRVHGTSAADANVVDPAACHPDRLLVKLAEGTGAQLRDGVLISRNGVDLQPVARWFAAAHAEPLIRALPWEELDRLHDNACAVLQKGRRPGHLGLWFRVTAHDAAAAARLLDALAAEPLVTHVYHEPRYTLAGPMLPAAPAAAAPPTDIPPVTPSFTSMQLSHGPSPVGHGVRDAAGVFGARGQGVHMFMIEESFLLDHEDASQLVASSFIGPVPPFDPIAAHHGLSGCAIVAADRNEYGITGISDEVQMRFLSDTLNGGIEDAIVMAVGAGQPGDVVLAVFMVLVPSLGPGTWLPFEFYQAGFDSTLTATANGFHVVVPAGNGNRSLDDPALLNRFDRSFRDSGAIMAGASAAGALTRAVYCNWGSRVDAHSWGDQVVSCGYGGLFFPNNDLRQAYTNAATGTSSSTPHLAGVVAMIQGAYRKQQGQTLTNAQMVSLLHAYGPTTPDVIGRRPDVPAILQALGVRDGLSVNADVSLGGTITATMDGPPGSIDVLFGAFATGDVDLGFNRHILIDLASMVSIDAFVMPAGTASWSLVVPTNPSLHDTDLYLQAVRLTAASPLHVSNSCQCTIL